MDTNLIDMIGQVGFPIGVAAFVLLRLEQTIKANTQALYMLAQRVGVNIADVQKESGKNGL